MVSVTPLAPVNLALGPLDQQVRSAALEAERAAAALARRDTSGWSSTPEVQTKIANRLGWLDSPQLMARSIERLTSFAAGIRSAGFTDIVLLGMGGSSLAPEVLRAIVGVATGWPRFHMLDSTDPAAVRAAATTPSTTLYILASKSGGTIEPNSLAAHFRATLEVASISKWADHFIAITDEGTDLAKRARAEHFRDVFINPSDIGGRYSALSFFGMVPSALMGQDIATLISGGVSMVDAALASSPAIESPEVGWKTDDGNGQKKDRESHENAIEAHSSRPHARESLRNPANDGYRSTQRRFIAGPSRRSSGDCASFPTASSLPSVFAYRVNEPRPGQLSQTFCASLGVSDLAF